MSISRLSRARIAVLGGRLLEGSVVAGMTADLIHDGQRVQIYVKGVVLDAVRPGADILSLTVDLRQQAMGLASVGDWVVSAS